MCNAWNHPIGCTCGWGGQGHAGRSTGWAYQPPAHRASAVILDTQYRSLASFTMPNSPCPVCGEPVFFYQSPHGGKVYFDSLGPPWPKHPCTDNPYVPRGIVPPKPQSHPAQAFVRPTQGPTWATDGWIPFICQRIRRGGSAANYCQLDGLLGEAPTTLFLCVLKPPSAALIQAKQIRPDEYAISMVWIEQGTNQVREMKTTAFLNAIQAITWTPPRTSKNGPQGRAVIVVKSADAAPRRHSPPSPRGQNNRTVHNSAKRDDPLTARNSAVRKKRAAAKKAAPARPHIAAEPKKYGGAMWDAFVAARAKARAKDEKD